MTLPTGTISLSQVNTELDISPSSTTINMGATAVRTLADAPSGAIAMSDLQGKSNAQFIQATGGTIATQGDFKVHTFNSNATFTVQGVGNEAGSNTVEYLVVAGGGSGGAGYGGGGGAGGFRVNYPSPAAGGLPVSAQGYPITIGGGSSGAPNARYTTKGQDGSNSTFSSITSESVCVFFSYLLIIALSIIASFIGLVYLFFCQYNFHCIYPISYKHSFVYCINKGQQFASLIK